MLSMPGEFATARMSIDISLYYTQQHIPQLISTIPRAVFDSIRIIFRIYFFSNFKVTNELKSLPVLEKWLICYKIKY